MFLGQNPTIVGYNDDGSPIIIDSNQDYQDIPSSVAITGPVMGPSAGIPVSVDITGAVTSPLTPVQQAILNAPGTPSPLTSVQQSILHPGTTVTPNWWIIGGIGALLLMWLSSGKRRRR